MNKIKIKFGEFIIYMLIMFGIGVVFGYDLTEKYVYKKVNEKAPQVAQANAIDGYNEALRQIINAANNPDKTSFKKSVDSTVKASGETGILIPNITIYQYGK